MKVGIYGRLLQIDNTPYIQQLFDTLFERDIEVTIHEQFYAHLIQRIDFDQQVETFKTHEDLKGETDFMLSIGGDGTFLETVTYVRDSGIPIAGINIGRLGFLANIGKKEIVPAIDNILEGTYHLDQRSLLKLESNKPIFDDFTYALNDVAIHKQDTSSMVTLHAYINGHYLNTYWADGLVVATPTGSTAYSLSCGGPIIFPDSRDLVITPVAPHNLNVRPIVVSHESVIAFEIEGKEENFMCTLDSRYQTIDSSFQLAVKKADFSIKLIRLHDESFMNTLRNKLMWGVDTRN